MAEKVKAQAVVISMEQLSDDIYSLWIKEQTIAAEAKAGQFISFFSKDGSKLLPRPISICEIDKANGALRVVFRVVGFGTKE